MLQKPQSYMKKIYNIHFILFSLSLSIFLSNCESVEKQPQLPQIVDFNFHIKPILSDRCFKCHGPDEKAREADLRLDTEEGAFAALGEKKDHFAIVAGDLDKSQLYHRITSDDPDELMPPPESNLSLSAYEVQLLGKWIKQGAEWKEHWAFIKPKKAELPKISDKKWPQNEIDYFVLARLQKEGLSPEKEETKEKWLRRVSFDLTGLPPSLEELDAFLADESDNAYEKVVDKLLASDAYGERMASPWLDAARYADSHGYQDDRPRTIWPWRDWVIEAFNQNMPYDSFLIQQIAGDLLPNTTYKTKLATAFNRNHGITQEGGVVNEEYITEYVADRTNTLSTAVLGLTMECARCHDHKYDPLSQKDYYQLFAFFNTLEEKGQISYFDLSPKPNIRMEDAELEAQLAWIDSMIRVKEIQLEEKLSTQPEEFSQWTKSELPQLSSDDLLSNGLISHHTFNEYDQLASPNELAFAHTAKANTGLIGVIAEPALTEGYLENALAFDGENFMNLGDIGDFEWYNHFSYGGWINHSGKFEKALGIFTKRNGEQKRGGYDLILLPDRRLQVSIIHNQRKERIVVQTKKKLQNGIWTHVFTTYDGSGKAKGLKVFINGIEQEVDIENDELDRKSILNGNDFIVGHWTHRNLNNGSITGFKGGKLDDIRIYGRDLSAWEVGLLAGSDPDDLNPNTAYPLFLKQKDQNFQQTSTYLDSLRSEHFEIPYIMIMEEPDTLPRKTHLLARGSYDAPTEEVVPQTPNVLLPFSEKFPKNRLGLAQWLTHSDHPLTARVIVNRCWQLMFGRGIVKTTEDFGSQGDLPSHPELLDWLAVDLVENGWNLKRLMKQIALSATYRQSSKISPKKYKRDSENILLARGPNQRFSAEMIRDNALAISGLINRQVGGPWMKPYQPKGVWKALANQIGENKYRPSHGNRLYRRSLYSYWKRTIPPPMMLTFDAAERTVCVVKRQSTSTPLQALVLLNDPQYIETSRVFAERILQEGGEDLEARIRWGFRMATSRWPSQNEVDELGKLFEEINESIDEDPESLTTDILKIGEYRVPAHLDPKTLAVYSVLANTLLNLDEAKMKS